MFEKDHKWKLSPEQTVLVYTEDYGRGGGHYVTFLDIWKVWGSSGASDSVFSQGWQGLVVRGLGEVCELSAG